MVPHHGAVEKWFNSPDFLSDIRRFESCRHHHMLGWRTRSARWTENPKTMVQLHPQAPKNLIEIVLYNYRGVVKWYHVVLQIRSPVFD